MRVFEFAGVIFNADNVCTIQKVNLKKENSDEVVPGIQIVTVAGGMNFSFESEEKRDAKFNDFVKGLENL